ncbi:topoisomerase DNA-binding C4 zinc finger domain-containing protein [Paenibacillus sp. 2TAF8]
MKYRQCGAVIVKRKNKAGSEFWGCSNFPNCRKTKAV